MRRGPAHELLGPSPAVRFFRSLQGKILLFFLVLDVATVGVLTVIVADTAREALEARIEEQLQLKARVASRAIEEQLALKWSGTQALAFNTFLVNSVMDPVEGGEFLEPFMHRLQLPGVGGAQTDLWLLDFEGNVLARNSTHTTHPEGERAFAEESWWLRVREVQPVAAVLPREGQSRLLLAFPVVYHHQTAGAVVAEFDVALLRDITARDGFDAVLLGAQGPLFGSLSPAALERVRGLGAAAGQQASFALEDTIYRVEPLPGFAHEHGLGWSLVLSMPAERVSGPVEQLRQRMALTGAALASVFAVLIIWGTRRLLRPLRHIEGTMRRIVSGEDLGQRITLRSGDELGSIARTFNEMLERLERHTTELEHSREQLGLLAHITSASPSAIVLLDPQERVLVWNEAAERLFGWSREVFSESAFLERAIPEAVRATVQELMARASAQAPAEAELTLVTHAAGSLPVQLTVSRIMAADGAPLGHVFIVRDLREVKRLRESLVHAEKMAAVGTLVAGLSHELNNPLGIILGFAQGLVKRPGLDEGTRQAVASIERQALRCAGLVRTLLDFSRRKVPVRERVAVGSLFARVGELVSGQARRGDIHLEILPPPEELPEMEVSVQEVESALLNLITNALDATPGGGSVSVSARAGEGDGVEVVVSDTGSGMPEEVLQRAFDPFFTTKPVGHGTGLGLSITRNIVEAHGGTIDVETAPGAGTKVRLWLPARGAPFEAHSREATEWK